MASNKTLKQILTALYSTLTAAPSLVPDTVRQIVKGVDIDHSLGFPFVRIYLLQPTSPLADNLPTFERVHTFVVEIVQEAVNKSKQNAEEDFLTAVEGVTNRLNATWQLGIGVENCEIQPSPATSQEINGSLMRVCKIIVAVTTLVENPS